MRCVFSLLLKMSANLKIAVWIWEVCSTSEELLMQMLHLPHVCLYFGMAKENSPDDQRPERSDDVTVFCYSIVMVPSKRSLHQASGRGLELDSCYLYC